MGKPITTTKGGICFAFPNVCKTPVPPPPTQVPIPYPSIGQLKDATGTSPDVNAGSNPVVTTASTIASTTGDSAGTGLGVKGSPPSIGGPVKFTAGSASVFANGNAVVRMGDPTDQNNGNAVGKVLGGFPKVLVGG